MTDGVVGMDAVTHASRLVITFVVIGLSLVGVGILIVVPLQLVGTAIIGDRPWLSFRVRCMLVGLAIFWVWAACLAAIVMPHGSHFTALVALPIVAIVAVALSVPASVGIQEWIRWHDRRVRFRHAGSYPLRFRPRWTRNEYAPDPWVIIRKRRHPEAGRLPLLIPYGPRHSRPFA